jgi:hypothetical protein
MQMHDPSQRDRQGVWLRVLQLHCVERAVGEHTGPRWPRRTEALDLGTRPNLLDAVDHDQKRAGVQARACKMRWSMTASVAAYGGRVDGFWRWTWRAGMSVWRAFQGPWRARHRPNLRDAMDREQPTTASMIRAGRGRIGQRVYTHCLRSRRPHDRHRRTAERPKPHGFGQIPFAMCLPDGMLERRQAPNEVQP